MRVIKLKTKVVILANHIRLRQSIKLSKVESNIGSRHEAREMSASESRLVPALLLIKGEQKQEIFKPIIEHSKVKLKQLRIIFDTSVPKTLDFQSRAPGLDSTSLPLDGFVFGGPEFKSYTLCK